jgi:hypothetical protein
LRLTAMIVTAAVVGLAPFVALAQSMPAPSTAACATMDANLPADLTGWSAKAPMAAATKASGLSKAMLSTGQGVEATLPLTPDVTFVTQPEKPGGTVSHGGMFGLNIDKAGTYVIALSSGAWIDVLKDGKPLVSTAHARGPECSTLRKMVDFPLQPGRYVLQVSANADPTLRLMLARRP